MESKYININLIDLQTINHNLHRFLGFNGNRTGVIQETGPQSNSDHLTTSLGLFDGHAIVKAQNEKKISLNLKKNFNMKVTYIAVS